MFSKQTLISILAVISMISNTSMARERSGGNEPNPPRYGGDNPSPDHGRGGGGRGPEPRPGNGGGGDRGPGRGGDGRGGDHGGRGPRDPHPGPRPGGPRDPHPGPRPGPGPRPTPPPYIPPPYDPNPYDPSPGYGEVRREIYLNRQFGNETLNLRRLAGLGYEFQDHSIVAVEVQLNNARYANADLQLRVNGYVEDSQRANRDYLSLRPRSGSRLGSNMDSVLLDVRGVADFRSITVILSNRGGGGYDPSPRIEEVNVSLYRSVGSNERINLAQYVDLRRYAGWVLDSMVINARADGRAGLIDVVVQGGNQATVTIEPYDRSYMVGLYGRSVLDGRTSIDLLTRGYMTVNTVTLRLVRR